MAKNERPHNSVNKTYGITDAKGEKLMHSVVKAIEGKTYKTETLDALFPRLTNQEKYLIFLYSEVNLIRKKACLQAQVTSEIVENMLGGLGAIKVTSAKQFKEMMEKCQKTKSL
jgi:hypothetical protein